MSHPYSKHRADKVGKSRAKVIARQDGGAVLTDRERLYRRGAFIMKLQGGDHNDWFPSNYRLANQGEKDRRETLNISRKFRKED